jgi:putative oxidoreductase
MSANMNADRQPSLLFLARIFIAALFLVAGTRKLLTYAATAGYFAKLGFPAPDALAGVAIAIELGAGLMLLAGWRTRWAAWLLVVFVAVATAMAHRFWQFEPAQFANQLNHFLKNLAIIGGLFFVATFGPGRMALDKS